MKHLLEEKIHIHLYAFKTKRSRRTTIVIAATLLLTIASLYLRETEKEIAQNYFIFIGYIQSMR